MSTMSQSSLERLPSSPLTNKRTTLTDLPPELLHLIYANTEEDQLPMLFSLDQNLHISYDPLAQVSRYIRTTYMDYAKKYARTAIIVKVTDYDFSPVMAYFDSLSDQKLRDLEQTTNGDHQEPLPRPYIWRFQIELHFTTYSPRLRENLQTWLDRIVRPGNRGNGVDWEYALPPHYEDEHQWDAVRCFFWWLFDDPGCTENGRQRDGAQDVELRRIARSTNVCSTQFFTNPDGLLGKSDGDARAVHL